MRFVQVKSAEQQGRLMLHRTRDLLMRQRTQLINALRAHLAELGIVAAQGNAGLKELLKIIAGEREARLPVDAHASLVVLAAGLHAVLPFSWSSPVPNAGQWLGSTPAGCEVCRGSLQ
jgi:transposase